MRQKDDKEFSLMLNRIRIGMPLKEDIDCLNKRIIEKKDDISKIENTTNKFLELRSTNPSIITLLAKTEDVDQYNKTMTDKLNIQTASCKANDILPNELNFHNNNFKMNKNRREKKNKCKSNKFFKTSHTAGLESELLVGINSRVILKRNIDVERGLANGSLGTVTKLNYNLDNSEILSLNIKFDNIDAEVEIERITADFEYQKRIYASRTQFPLSLAWALTIHKTQGLSLNAVIIDLGGDIFEGGMAYVALSRARKLCNVYLIDFYPEKLYCNFNAIHEYNRLYESANQIDKKINFFNIIPISSSNKRKLTQDLFSFTEYQSEKSAKKLKLILNNHNKNETGENKSNKKTPLKKKPQTKEKTNNLADKPVDENRQFLRLSNTSNACFANSTIQAFLSLGNPFFEMVNNNLFFFLAII